MPLDPQVQTVLDKIREAGNPEYWQMTPQQARDWHNRKAGILDVKPEPVFKVQTPAIEQAAPIPALGPVATIGLCAVVAAVALLVLRADGVAS